MINADRDSRADALLDSLASERGGRLKVFLGAAPGVGKTFAMLNAARELRRQNVDVVVGLVETHGRAETQALIEGLEVLPRLQLDYKGRTVEEMDLDGLLRRRPEVALVDELAHRNAPGSRHQRRFQDIGELLDAGIDVYTTVNIQHLESLNDQVMALTGLRVRETVPDTFMDRAGDVVLVDLPPRELIERLHQGKVYVPEQATSALASFFSPSNLTALRELAVQQVADRVDADLRGEMAARGLAPLPVRSRVLVAIDGLDNSEYLVRATRKLAERRQAPWTVVYVDTGRAGAARTQGAEAAFALARKLGADTTLLRGASVVEELLVYARRQAVSTIVVGRTRERPIARMFNQTLTQQLLQGGAHFELTILNTPYLRAQSRRRANAGEVRRSLPEYALAVLASAAATAIAALAERFVNLDDLSLVFITAVLIVAARTRMAVAVVTAVLCFLAYNFFFIEPRYTFIIGASEGIATVMFFLAAALIAGRLASRLRGQVLSLRAANAHAGAMQALSRRLAVAGSDDEVLRAAARSLRESLDADVALLTVAAGTGSLGMAVSEPGSVVLDATALAAADWSAHHRQPAGRYTDTLNASAWWCLPLGGDGSGAGSVALRFDAGIDRLPPELRVLASSMVQDVADALGRVRLGEALEASRVQGETERLRAALLASVSHDLRSPLATIIGSAESLAMYRERLDDNDQRALAEGILGEGRRLDGYIQNLLDMTRLGHGALKLQRDWVGLDEILGSASARLRKLHPRVPVDTHLPTDPPLLYVHAALVEQALFNILENAATFSPEDTPVTVQASLSDREWTIDVVDRGPGIPEDERRRIFDPFYSVARGDRGGQGTGLGLVICQGMIGAHGGRVEAFPGNDGVGTRIRVTLPASEPPPASADEQDGP